MTCALRAPRIREVRLDEQGRPVDVEALLREGLTPFRQAGNLGTNAVTLLGDLAVSLANQKKWTEAEAAVQEALGRAKELLGCDDCYGVAVLKGRLGLILTGQGKSVEAEPLLREATTALHRQQESAEEALQYEFRLLAALHDQGKVAEAEAMLWRNWRLAATPALGLSTTAKPSSLSAEQAVQALTAAIQNRSTNDVLLPTFLCARAALFARQGRSQEAAADLAQFVETDNSALCLPLVPLWMDSGDARGYESYRQRLLARFNRLQRGYSNELHAANSKPASELDPETAGAVALALLVYPSAVSYEVTSRPADFAIEHGAHHVRLPHFQMVKGLAEYRLGKLESASNWICQSLTNSVADPPTTVMANAVLAMAEFQLKQLPDARLALGRAQSVLQTNQPPSGSGTQDLGHNWIEWLIARLLVNEARAALESRQSDTKPFKVFDALAATNGPRQVIVATVNDKPIFDVEVGPATGTEEALRRQYLPDHPAEFQRRLEALRRQNIESLIVRELIVIDALEAGYEVPKQHLDEHIASLIATNYYGDSNLFLKVLAQQGRTLEQLREDIRGHDLIVTTRHKNTSNIPAPTPEQIEAYYTKHQTNYWQPEAVQLSMLVLSLSPPPPPATRDSQRRLAHEIRNRLVSGLDFADAAKLYSEHAQTHSANPEWFERGTLRKELDEAAFALKPGDLSEVIEVEFQLYILQVQERRPARLQPLVEVQKQIQAHLRKQAEETMERDWIATLRSKAIIRRFP